MAGAWESVCPTKTLTALQGATGKVTKGDLCTGLYSQFMLT